MFWILKIFPDWFWWLTLIAGFSGYFLAHLIPLKSYQMYIKIAGAVLVALSIFIFGLQHADNKWQQAAKELQIKVQVAEAESKTANAQIETKVVTKTQLVKQKGETVVKYIDREVVKIDERCTIPPEFVNAHNQAATK
jgi:uncharacterized membrane protein